MRKSVDICISDTWDGELHTLLLYLAASLVLDCASRKYSAYAGMRSIYSFSSSISATGAHSATVIDSFAVLSAIELTT
jgi:hypothetical protein